MEKKKVVLLLFGVLVFAVITNMTNASAYEIKNPAEFISSFFGIEEDVSGFQFNVAIVHWFILGLIILLIYSALSFANFPDTRSLNNK